MRYFAFAYLRVVVPLCRQRTSFAYCQASLLQTRSMAEDTASAKPVVDESVPLVLVTGATGFIATHVLKQLLTSGKYRVRGTIRSLKNETKVKELKELVPDAKYPLDLCEAELLNKECWPSAVQGCKYVFHLASPFPSSAPKKPDDIIRPAVEGTTNVLSACAESGTVKKLVLTSSVAAISCGAMGHPGKKDHVYTEEDWSPPEACPPYERSKVLAEKAGWDFVKELPAEKKFEMVAVNPGFVVGPAITKGSGTSVGFVANMLKGDVPGAPDVNFMMVDVRDVAKGHINALEKPDNDGNRYLLVSESAVPFLQVCHWVKDEFGPQGYKIGTMKVPKVVAWLGSKFNADLKMVYPNVGKKVIFNNKKMVEELGIQPISAKQAVIDSGYSIIELGIVKKTTKYHGQGGAAETTGDADTSGDK